MDPVDRYMIPLKLQERYVSKLHLSSGKESRRALSLSDPFGGPSKLLGVTFDLELSEAEGWYPQHRARFAQ